MNSVIGVLLYYTLNNKIFIVLNKKSNNWFSFEELETCNLFNKKQLYRNKKDLCMLNIVDTLYYIDPMFELNYSFIVNNTTYKIGLLQVESKYINSNKCITLTLDLSLKKKLNKITLSPIMFYWSYLKDIQNSSKYKNTQISKDAYIAV